MDVLRKASVPLIEVPETYDHGGILKKIRIVGEAIGAGEKAEALAASVDSELKAAEKLAAGITERKRVLFILSAQGGKLMVSGDGTAANGMIELAGGVNAIEGFSGYKQLSDEAALVARPDVMMDRGGDHAAGDADLLAHPAIASTPAGRDKRLTRMDGGYLLGFGPRTAGAIRDLAAALYGEQVED